MKFVDEFKTFINRGNAFDMAVGIIVGASFTKIVDSLVKDILMPLLGFFLGGIDLSFLSITLKKQTDISPAVIISYGKFLNAIVDFFIIAFSVFLMIKFINSLTRRMKHIK